MDSAPKRLPRVVRWRILCRNTHSSCWMLSYPVNFAIGTIMVMVPRGIRSATLWLDP